MRIIGFGVWHSLTIDMTLPRLGWLLTGVVVGLGLQVWSRRQGRRELPRAGAVLRWDEKVVGAWRQDWAAGLLISLHTVGVVLLTVLAVLDVTRSGVTGPLGWAASSAHVALGMMAGAAVGYPIAALLAPPMPMALYPQGVVRGRFVSEWSSYGHFVADPGTGIIRLYGSRTPDVARVGWRPPNEALFHEVVGFLRRHLPARPAVRVPWYRRRIALLSASAAAAGLPVVAGYFVLKAEVSWAPLYYTGAAYVLSICVLGLVRCSEVH